MTEFQKLVAQHRASRKRWLKLSDAHANIKLISKEFEKMHRMRAKIQKVYNERY